MQFHLLPIRDWNKIKEEAHTPSKVLQFHLLPIRDWNQYMQDTPSLRKQLQFHLLPIRDWNLDVYAYSFQHALKIAISLTPY